MRIAMTLKRHYITMHEIAKVFPLTHIGPHILFDFSLSSTVKPKVDFALRHAKVLTGQSPLFDLAYIAGMAACGN